MNNINPFNITKAVDYSDEEINKYWVEMPGNYRFSDIIKPQSPMPMMILGGKGSGKTHIMRYFSFNSQKIRHQKKLIENIGKDKYVGVFMRCGGLNASKFSGESQSGDAWKNIFAYYLELWYSQLIIDIIGEILTIVPDKYANAEIEICNAVLNLFDKKDNNNPQTLSELKNLLHALQKGVDYEVNNCAITGEKISNFRILVSPGQLIFGLPRILTNILDFLKDVQFIYLIDEYENLMEYQQKYINTLIREREAPVSFRIGARWYGIKTRKTFSGDEDLKEGSEYEKSIIDELLRDKMDNYEKFAKSICISRLNQAGFNAKINESTIDSYFAEFNIADFFEKIRTKEPSVRYRKFSKLEALLGKKMPAQESSEIIGNLKYEINPLLERTNLFLFYRALKNGGNLLKESERIKNECLSYERGEKLEKSEHGKVLSKFKSDLIDQLHRETNEDLPYSGFDKLVKMSAGIPRLLLIMLKHVYRWSIYNGERPFKDGLISQDSQHKGLEDAIKWFMDDARVPGNDGKVISNSINRIGRMIHEIRFSDLPPECSLSSFSINEVDTTDAIQKYLDYLEQYSYLIKVSERRPKNSSSPEVTYQINGLLAPKWEISIHRRGVLALKKHEVQAIFEINEEHDFDEILNQRLLIYNSPFKQKTATKGGKGKSPLLFE